MTRCAKVRYLTRVDALLALSRTEHRARTSPHPSASKRHECRTYHCYRCRGWHLTSEVRA